MRSDHSGHVSQDQADAYPREAADSRNRQTHEPCAQYGPAVAGVAGVGEPKYPERRVASVVDPYVDQLRSWLETDSHRPKRDRRTARVMLEAIWALG